MIAEGILAAEVKTDRLLRAASGFPIGTRTQIIRWMDNTGKVVLVTHRYVDAEGKPLTDHDPKFLLVDEEEWHVSG